MNLPTSRRSRSLSFDSDCAAASTCDEAEPVSDAPRCTLAMFEVTSEVPSAAFITLREISLVAALCSSTAEAIDDAISEIWAIVLPISLMPAADSCVAVWISAICWVISPVALRGLIGQRLHFRCNNGEAAAGIAGTGPPRWSRSGPADWSVRQSC